MIVKAKFHCNTITLYEGSRDVSMNAIYGTVGENADFTRYTPSGTLTITIDSEAPAAELFKVGKDYYLYFEDCENATSLTQEGKKE